MTIPDELVQAAAEAIHDYLADPIGSTSHTYHAEDYARVALQAAFTKLPECEAAEVDEAFRVAIGSFCMDDPDEVAEAVPLVRRSVFAALAREFGGQE